MRVLLPKGHEPEFALTQEELAFLVSSHSGEKEHVALAQSVLAKVGLTPDALACGAAKPMSGKAATAVLQLVERGQNRFDRLRRASRHDRLKKGVELLHFSRRLDAAHGGEAYAQALAAELQSDAPQKDKQN